MTPPPASPASAPSSGPSTRHASGMDASGTGASGAMAGKDMGMKPYIMLAAALGISFVVMFVSGYARTAAWDHLYLNANRFYMTALMVAPMALVMLATMGSMFTNRRLNTGIALAALVLTVLFWGAIRTQAGVGDRAFLRSMIPHHSAAILVCENATLRDPRVVALCREIVAAQKREIAEMQALLAE